MFLFGFLFVTYICVNLGLQYKCMVSKLFYDKAIFYRTDVATLIINELNCC